MCTCENLAVGYVAARSHGSAGDLDQKSTINEPRSRSNTGVTHVISKMTIYKVILHALIPKTLASVVKLNTMRPTTMYAYAFVNKGATYAISATILWKDLPFTLFSDIPGSIQTMLHRMTLRRDLKC